MVAGGAPAELLGGLIRDGAPIALYPSSGADPRPPARLQATDLRARFPDAREFPELAAFVYIDRRAPWELRRAEGGGVGPFELGAIGEVAGARARVLRARERPSVPILALGGDNREVAARLFAGGLRPRVLIGISDGCRVGGNPACVCSLSPTSPIVAHVGPWWVVDHFDGDAPARAGLVVPRAADPGSPLSFRKIGSVDPEWGHYDGTIENPWRGATLFRRV